jgi:hypothetical protein
MSYREKADKKSGQVSPNLIKSSTYIEMSQGKSWKNHENGLTKSQVMGVPPICIVSD